MANGAQRFDVGRLSKETIQRTPSRGARIPAALTRVGVLRYTNPDGSPRLELRPPEEVFKADSLATLRDAPVVERHPAMIDPSNWEEHACGHVSGEARADGDYVAADLAVLKAGTLTKIDAGEIVEISCGYVCDEDPTPGVWNGQPYHLVQRNIRYNHVGLGPENWGRAGRDARLRLDSAMCVLDQADHRGEPPKAKKKMKIRFDEHDYEMGSEELYLAMARKIDAKDAALLAKTEELEDACKAKEKADAERDTALAEQAKLKAKLDEALDQKRIDAAVAERVELCVSAGKVLGDDFKFDGMSSEQIMKAAVLKVYPERKLDGRSADYLQAAFDSLVETGVRADTIDAVPGVISGVARKLDGQSKEPSKPPAGFDNTPRWDATKGDK